jgi:hypothetical protein
MDTQTVILSPAERVAAGMAWIDENAERLNLDLDRVIVDVIQLYSDRLCVLAQAGGRTYTSIITKAQSTFLPTSYDHNQYGALGLDVYTPATIGVSAGEMSAAAAADRTAVHAAWVAAITARRQRAA